VATSKPSQKPQIPKASGQVFNASSVGQLGGVTAAQINGDVHLHEHQPKAEPKPWYKRWYTHVTGVLLLVGAILSPFGLWPIDLSRKPKPELTKTEDTMPTGDTYYVSSDGQSGGITAGKVIVNAGSPGRSLTDASKAKIDDFMASKKPVLVRITIAGNTPEPKKYADQIADYMRQKGFPVGNDYGYSNRVPPVVGVQIKGPDKNNVADFYVGLQGN
jgi:hypothetical protein